MNETTIIFHDFWEVVILNFNFSFNIFSSLLKGYIAAHKKNNIRPIMTLRI